MAVGRPRSARVGPSARRRRAGPHARSAGLQALGDAEGPLRGLREGFGLRDRAGAPYRSGRRCALALCVDTSRRASAVVAAQKSKRSARPARRQPQQTCEAARAHAYRRTCSLEKMDDIPKMEVSDSGGEVSASVEETNRIRAALGLKPLKVEGSSGVEDHEASSGQTNAWDSKAT